MFQTLVNRFRALPAGRGEAVSYLLLASAVLLVYANVYQGVFLFDDKSLIVMNRFLRDWSHLPDILTRLNYAGSGREGSFYRPITMLMYWFVYQTFGVSAPAFHALNVILHALNTGLMYRLGRKLGFTAGAVFSAALLWSMHPLQTSDVSYISSTAELLWTTFTLLGLLAFMRPHGSSILFFLLALGCKETAVVFPALTAACLFISSNDRLKPATYVKTWPFWLLSAFYAVMYACVSDYHRFESASPDLDVYTHHIFPRIFTSLATLPVYLKLMIYPTKLYMERLFPVFESVSMWPVLTGVVLAAGALMQIILGQGKRGLPLSFGFFWFAAALSPVTGIVVPVDALISEGWLYMPMMGLFLGVAQTLAVRINGMKFKGAPVIAAAAVAAAALHFGVKTHSQNEVYRNPVTFFENIARCGGNRLQAYPNLGTYYLNRGDFDNAIKFFKLAVENPNPRNVPPAYIHMQMAMAYLGVSMDAYYMISADAVAKALPHATRITEAISELKEALKADPDFYFAHRVLSVIYGWQGDKKKAGNENQQMRLILQKRGG